MKLRLFIVLILFVLVPSVAVADAVVADLDWSRLRTEGRLSAGEVTAPEGGEPGDCLKITNAAQQPAVTTLVTLDAPRIRGSRYAIVGRVRCEGVEGDAYLEMWSVFPDGGRYFSRTMADSGPLGMLRGTQEWRPFLLAFNNQEGGPAPTQLIFNVAFQGRGTVVLGPAKLVELETEGAAAGGAWWSPTTAGLIGAVLGCILGLLGSIVGVLLGRGAARGFVLPAMKVVVAIGLAVLIVGIASIALSQPYHVWYPLVLTGAIGTVVFGILLPVARRRYEALELRRMRAMDAS